MRSWTEIGRLDDINFTTRSLSIVDGRHYSENVCIEWHFTCATIAVCFWIWCRIFSDSSQIRSWYSQFPRLRKHVGTGFYAWRRTRITLTKLLFGNSSTKITIIAPIRMLRLKQIVRLLWNFYILCVCSNLCEIKFATLRSCWYESVRLWPL